MRPSSRYLAFSSPSFQSAHGPAKNTVANFTRSYIVSLHMKKPSGDLTEMFAQDRQGRRFSDVRGDGRINFDSVLAFFDDERRQVRMEDSEEHHLRPALAGVIREFEGQREIAGFLSGNDGHTTVRFRQAVGVAVRIVMEARGWGTTGRKGSLGTRVKVTAGTTTPGAYENDGGLSRWFVRAERYRRLPTVG